jgi:APA family basic amino acid/polyamine antiporter
MLITLDDLRHFAVAHSLFTPTTLTRALHRLGYVQADPIRAPARAQDLMLRHRVKDYRDGDLERHYAKLGVEEDVFVNYGFVTRSIQALMHPRSDSCVPAEGYRPWPRLVPAVGTFAAVMAAGAILAFAAMQWFGVRLSARVLQAASAIATLALIGLVVGCFLVRTPASTEPAPPAPAGSFVVAMVLAIQSIVVTYDGWYEPIYFAEETRHPTHQLPRAMFGGLALLAGIYLLLNVAFLRALGPAGLAASKFAAADAARLIFGRASEIVISVVAVVILLTLLNSVLMSSTRILFAVSRDGLFWRRAAQVAENGTPRPALALATLVAVGLVLSGTVDRLIAMAGFFYVANYCWAYISLIVLRRTQPAAARPFRVFAYPALTLLTLACSLAFLVGAVVSDWRNSLYALLLLMASFPVRSLFRSSRKE